MGDVAIKDGYDENVQAMFVYGTLRPDYSKNGDAWGVTQGCTSFAATGHGFRLYQAKHTFYPFTKHTGSAEDVVKGVLLTWPGDRGTFRDKLNRCDGIEGYNAADKSKGLYLRSIITAYLSEAEEKKARAHGLSSPMKAYIYHQDASENEVNESEYYPTGDWFEGGRNKKS